MINVCTRFYHDKRIGQRLFYNEPKQPSLNALMRCFEYIHLFIVDRLVSVMRTNLSFDDRAI